MPRSRSMSFESITRSCTAWFSRKVPDCLSIPSTSVVLPWSTCAIMAILRKSSLLIFIYPASHLPFSGTFIDSTILPWYHTAKQVCCQEKPGNFSNFANVGRKSRLLSGSFPHMRRQPDAGGNPSVRAAPPGRGRGRPESNVLAPLFQKRQKGRAARRAAPRFFVSFVTRRGRSTFCTFFRCRRGRDRCVRPF